MNINAYKGEIILSPIPLGELLTALKPLLLEVLTEKQEKELQERFISPAETCNLFSPKISKPTLAKWTKEGRLQEHRIGSRVYYKYSQVNFAWQINTLELFQELLLK